MRLFLTLLVILPILSWRLEPLVIVPGLGGPQLEVKLTNAHPRSEWCRKNSGWYTIWVNLSEDLRWLDISCFEFIVQVFWDNVTHVTRNNAGVDIRAKDFGGVEGIRYIDEHLPWLSRYFEDTLVYLRDTYGYVWGENLVGAPFDFRLGPQDLTRTGYFQRLKELVEKTFERNNSKVHLLGHSQGVAALSHFLSYFVTKDWKDKYVATMMSLAGVWDGANEGFGYPFAGAVELPSWLQIKALEKFEARIFKYLRNWPGIQWVIPHILAQDEVVVKTKKKEYKGSQFVEMMNDAGLYEIGQEYEYVAKDRTDVPPNVPLHCIYTDNMRTPLQFYIDDVGNPTEAYVSKWGLGDGQVQNSNHFLCDGMAKRQSEPVNVYRTTDVSHDFMPRDERVIDYIASVIVKPD